MSDFKRVIVTIPSGKLRSSPRRQTFLTWRSLLGLVANCSWQMVHSKIADDMVDGNAAVDCVKNAKGGKRGILALEAFIYILINAERMTNG